MAQGDFARGLNTGSNIIGDAVDLEAKKQQFAQRLALDQAIADRTAAIQQQQLGLEGQNVDLRRKEYESNQAAIQRQLAGSDALAGAISAPSTVQGVGLSLPPAPAPAPSVTAPSVGDTPPPSAGLGFSSMSGADDMTPPPSSEDDLTPSVTSTATQDNRPLLQRMSPESLKAIAEGGGLDKAIELQRYASAQNGNLIPTNVPGEYRDPVSGTLVKSELPVKTVYDPLTGKNTIQAGFPTVDDALKANREMQQPGAMGTSGNGILDLVNKKALSIPVDQANASGLPATVPIAPFGITPQAAMAAKTASDKNDDAVLASATAQAQKASDQIGKIHQFLQLAADGGGPIEGRNPLSSDVQQMQNLLNSEVFSNIPKGIGRLTDKEVQGLSKAFMLPSNNLEANQNIATQKLAAAQSVIDESKFFNDYKVNFGTLRGAENQWADYQINNPIVAPDGSVNKNRMNYQDYFRAKNGQDGVGASSAPAPAATSQIQTATNPQTGEKLQLVNGQWQPLK